MKARSNDKHSYTWNGDSANEYTSHGEGTFNISAINGLDGIYIGDKTLKELILELINNPPTSESTSTEEATTPGDTGTTEPETTTGDSTATE